MSTLPQLAGTTLSPSDAPRLNKQQALVFSIMRDGKPHTLDDLCAAARERGYYWGAPSLSARIRDLRRIYKLQVDREHLGNGLFSYTLVLPEQGVLWRE